jgi:MraZ protein
MFVGTHIVGVDGKGRVSIPAPFRAALKGSDTIYVWRSHRGACLEAGDEALLEKYKAAMAQAGETDREDLEYAIFSEVRPLAFDVTGRVSLPDDLRSHAGLNGKAAFTGLSDRFEIWEPKALDSRIAQARAQAQEGRAKLRRGL